MKYLIYASRHDIPEHIIDEFNCDSDDEAKGRFKDKRKEPGHEWDDLRLEKELVARKAVTIDVD